MATAPPWGADVPGVRNLVLNITEGNRPAGAIAVQRTPDQQVTAWIAEGAAAVAAAIRGYERLGPDPATGGEGDQPLVDAIELRAKSLTQMWAASLLAEVTYPERSGKAQLGASLYQRYVDGLADLTAEVHDQLELLDELSPPDDRGEASYGPVASFPAPFLRDRCNRPMRF
jgi:hypothetical protein